MTDEEQKRIFAKNLSYQISLTGKSQKDIAKDLDIKPTTLNMWVKGNSIPRVGTIQQLADYFHVPKSELVDEPILTGFDPTSRSSYYLRLNVYSNIINDINLKKLLKYAEKLAFEEHSNHLEEGESIWEYAAKNV